GDIVKITDPNDHLLGYNIFEASKHFTDRGTGRIQFTEDLLAEMKTLFKNEGLDDPLDFDLSPKFVVGHVLKKEQHEHADKLSVCEVDVGKEKLQIVCGASNVDENQKVVIAKV